MDMYLYIRIYIALFIYTYIYICKHINTHKNTKYILYTNILARRVNKHFLTK